MRLSLDAVVCTRDRPAELDACLRSLAVQQLPPRRVLVVDAGSVAAAPVIDGLEVEVVRAAPGLPRQRNVALARADADLVAFFDDDVEIEPGYLGEVIRFFEARPACVGVSGNILNDVPRALPSTLYRRVFGLADDDGSLRRSGDVAYLRGPVVPTRVDVISGANMTFRRETVAELRFREELGEYAYMEDADFALRAGTRGELWMLPTARLVHHVSPRSRLSRSRYVEEVFVNSTVLFLALRATHGLSWAAFIWRMTGRALAYAATALPDRSPAAIVGVARGARRMLLLIAVRRP
jgi:GT2 family glycosyltransferase